MAVTIFIPDVPEFLPLVYAAQKIAGCAVKPPFQGYWQLQAEGEVQFRRKELGLTPALWNSSLSGGFRGRIAEFSRDVLRIVSED